MEFSNSWSKSSTRQQKTLSTGFAHLELELDAQPIDHTWRRLVSVASELRNSELASTYQKFFVDEATMAASKFISLMPSGLLEKRGLVDFDVEIENSIELLFNGKQEVRVNLMIESLDTQEEAFVFYRREGEPTQTNGYMSEVVEILKHIL